MALNWMRYHLPARTDGRQGDASLGGGAAGRGGRDVSEAVEGRAEGREPRGWENALGGCGAAACGCCVVQHEAGAAPVAPRLQRTVVGPEQLRLPPRQRRRHVVSDQQSAGGQRLQSRGVGGVVGRVTSASVRSSCRRLPCFPGRAGPGAAWPPKQPGCLVSTTHTQRGRQALQVDAGCRRRRHTPCLQPSMPSQSTGVAHPFIHLVRCLVVRPHKGVWLLKGRQRRRLAGHRRRRRRRLLLGHLALVLRAGVGGGWVGWWVVGGGWWWWGGRSLRHAGQWAGTMLWQNQRLPAALARPPHHLVACHAAGDHLVDGGVLVDERKQLGAAVGVKAARRGKAGTALQGMQARGCSSCRAPPSRLQAGHTERPCHMPPHCAGSLNGRVVMLRPLLTAPSKRRPGSSARRRCAPRTAPASPCGPCLQPGGVGGGPQQAAGMNTLHAAGIASNPQTTVHTRSSRRHRSKARPTVACKVDAQHRLRQLWGHLLAGQVHAPVAVGVAVQAQIFAVGPRRCVQLLVVCGKAQEQACDARCEAVKQGRRGVGTGSVRRHRWRAQARARARAAPPFAARRQQPL